MKRFNRLLSVVVLAAMLALTCRFMLFHTYLRSLKTEFRLKVFSQPGLSVQKIDIDIKDLFVDSGSLQWKDNNKEVMLNGVFHEVVKIVRHNGTASIYLIEDRYESSLYAQFLQGEHKRDITFWYHLLASLHTILPHDTSIIFALYTIIGHTFNGHQDKLPGYPKMQLRPPCF